MAEQPIYTISRLNSEVRELLELNFPLLWVEGEISNLVRPHSGHLYFSLKDERAQVRCAMFRMHNNLLNFTPEDGQQVVAEVRLSLYEPRGDYQLIVQHLAPAGAGILRRRFEELKRRLQQEGLFAETHKRPIPTLPTQIGVVTSPTGAAIRDIISVLKRRFPSIPIIIYPTQVQGATAAKEIVAALTQANTRQECEVILLARGGGSLEDLWPFNEEIVARAIYNSKIPIVSGIGHEIDFTIADFVADQRAPTPSAAAELVSPDSAELLATLHNLDLQLTTAMRTTLRHKLLELKHLAGRLQHPRQKLQNYAQRLDHAEQRFTVAIKNLLSHKKSALSNASTILESISPLTTLKRGYAIASTEKDNKIIREAKAVKIDDKIAVRLKHGSLHCQVLRRHLTN